MEVRTTGDSAIWAVLVGGQSKWPRGMHSCSFAVMFLHAPSLRRQELAMATITVSQSSENQLLPGK